jgi:hypothetical protein
VIETVSANIPSYILVSYIVYLQRKMNRNNVCDPIILVTCRPENVYTYKKLLFPKASPFFMETKEARPGKDRIQGYSQLSFHRPRPLSLFKNGCAF